MITHTLVVTRHGLESAPATPATWARAAADTIETYADTGAPLTEADMRELVLALRLIAQRIEMPVISADIARLPIRLRVVEEGRA